ncbi:MAG TPA: hypothetical protein VJC12_01785 [Candidatus Paceibacterota bacterium]
MIKVNPSSINDLIALKSAGAPVTLTSHPGNASLYKLTLWKCGIPEHLWDVTCCKSDANNWPMFRLVGGQAELLVQESFYQQVMSQTNHSRRFVTAYQKTTTGERLGRFHVRVCEGLFPGVISSCSRLLLQEREKVLEVFSYLAETRGSIVFSRFIDSSGVMRPIKESGIKQKDLADSFLQVLEELDKLLFSDEPLTTVGGACYDGVMVPLATMLAQYWQTGRIDRYDVSGPDMIHYATKRGHQEELSEMLCHLRKWNPKLIPEHIAIRMFPGTVARVGHIPGHVSERVISRKIDVLRNHNQDSSHFKRLRWAAAEGDKELWPTEIKPSQDYYFSQHDLVVLGGNLEVDEFWRGIPIEEMKEVLTRANALLRLK